MDLGTLDGDQHVVFIGGHQDLLVLCFDSQEGEVVGRVKVPNEAACLFCEEGDVLCVVLAWVMGCLLYFLLSSKVVLTIPPL